MLAGDPCPGVGLPWGTGQVPSQGRKPTAASFQTLPHQPELWPLQLPTAVLSQQLVTRGTSRDTAEQHPFYLLD